MDLPATKNSRLSINNRQVISGIYLSIFRNTSIIYIRKKIEDTGDCCSILVSILHLGFINSLVITTTHLLVKKNCVYPTRSLRQDRLFFKLTWLAKTWSKVFFTSSSQVSTICQLFQILWTFWTNIFATSITNQFFLTPIWPL